jgi:hypothetical protein
MLTIDKDVQYLLYADILNQKPLEIVIIPRDRQILRELGEKIAAIGSLPVQKKTQEMWTRLNRLEMVKPMVWINEVCWNEVEVNDELTLRTSSPFCQRIESELLQTIYLWEHMPADMVVEPVIYSPLMVHNTGIGFSIEEDILKTGGDSITPVDGNIKPWQTFASHRYHNQIYNEEDIEKIKQPQIKYDEHKSQDYYEAYRDIFTGVLEVRKRGIPGFWFAPWDDIIMLTNAQQTLIDLAIRPDFIHKFMDSLVSAYLGALDQYESLNLLAPNNTNRRIGSGAYGYTDELPQSDFNPDHVRALDIWGSCAAQIFSDVSPEMHEEFGLAYERRWLERFGLTYYGCCEPLAKKMEILKSIHNLRKISVSPWNDMDEIAEKMAGDYVFSFKPSPAVFARDKWQPELARKDLEDTLSTASKHHCQVEIIMKDITTVRHEPQRLWEWAKIAAEVTEAL